MDRIRVGLTGLGVVFLLTAAVSMVFGPSDADVAADLAKEPGEPLAQLGVAPSNEKEKLVAPPAPVGAPPPSDGSDGEAEESPVTGPPDPAFARGDTPIEI